MIYSQLGAIVIVICFSFLSARAAEIQITVGSQADVPTLSEAVFKARAALKTNASVRILISGTQFLASPVYLGSDDSSLTIEGAGKGATISGGRVLTGWQKGSGAIWELQIPQVKSTAWFFRELFVNGERRPRARTPNSGYFRTDGPSIQGNPATFKYRPGDLKKAWADGGDTEVVGFINWQDFHMPLRAVDEGARTVTMAGDAKPAGRENDGRFYIENAPDALDSPGEWQLSSKTGLLRYWPMPGEDMTKVQVIAPMLPNLLIIGGDPDSKKAAQNITLRNITFSHTQYPLGSAGYVDAQAEYLVPGAVHFTFARNCLIEDCAFVHLGTYGLQLSMGVQNTKVRYCKFQDLGAGGIRIGERAWGQEPFSNSFANEVSDCEIHQLGRFFTAGVGILIFQSATNHISHNHIYDGYTTGISVGWTSGYYPNPTRKNLIEFNHIHDLGQGVLSDLGGIYTLGIQQGAVVQNNLIHDINCERYGAFGLYADEGSSQILFQNNVVYRCKVSSFALHFGRNNIVRNNILAFAQNFQFDRTREDEFYAMDFLNNIVYYDAGGLMGGQWSKNKFKFDRNIYFDARPNSKPNFAGISLEQWRARGHDKNSIISDPRFVDIQHDDFRLRPDSPALKLGFKPIDVSTVGPRPRR